MTPLTAQIILGILGVATLTWMLLTKIGRTFLLILGVMVFLTGAVFGIPYLITMAFP